MICENCHKSLINLWCLVTLRKTSDDGDGSDATDTCSWCPLDEESLPGTSVFTKVRGKKDSSSSDSGESSVKRMKTDISDFSEYKFSYSEDVEEEQEDNNNE